MFGMDKHSLIAVLLFLLFLSIPSIAYTEEDARYSDIDYGLIINLYAPREVKPTEEFTIRFDVYPALREYDLNIISAKVRLQSLQYTKIETLLSNFILEKGDYAGPPTIRKNITFKAGYGFGGDPGLVTCVLKLSYAPLNSANVKNVEFESVITWSSSSTYQEIQTEIRDKEGMIETYQKNAIVYMITIIVLAGAICLLSLKYLRKTKVYHHEEENS